IARAPMMRILHFAGVGRGAAGREEGFILRLSSEQMERYDLRVGSQVDQFASGPATHRDALTRLRDGWPDRAAAKKARRETATSHADALRQAGLNAAPGVLFAPMNAPIATAAEAARDRGVMRILGSESRGTSRFLLGANAFDNPYITTSTDAEGAVTSARFNGPYEEWCAFVRGRLDQSALERLDLAWLTQSDAALSEAMERLDGTGAEPTMPSSDDDAEETSQTGPPVTAELLEGEILRVVQARVGEMRAVDPETDEPLTRIERLQRELDSFQPPVGPADVVSYHDFHHLQMALPNVWTSLFDDRLSESARAFAEAYLEYGEDSELREPLETPPAGASTKAFIDVYRSATDLSASFWGEPMSPAISAMGARWPDAQARYDRMSPAQRATLAWISALPPAERTPELRNQVENCFTNPSGPLQRLLGFLSDIETRAREPHDFHIFRPNTVNFGIISTYRQAWTPEPYQVGDLVATLPLAPGEKRTLKKTETLKVSRNREEIEKAVSNLKSETAYTNRAVTEITKKASQKSNFQQNAAASADVRVGAFGANASSTTGFARDQAQESARVRKSHLEETRKAASEYRAERSLTLSEKSELEIEDAATVEISNTNDELSVTYLFYELERRYKMSEWLHRLQPVVLVAQPVPRPDEIDEDWILAHEWILRRVLLDPIFEPALDYVARGVGLHEITDELRQRNLERQRELVDELKENLAGTAEVQDDLAADVFESEMKLAEYKGMKGVRKKKSRIARKETETEALEDRLDAASEELADLKHRVDESVSALERMEREYIAAQEGKLAETTAIIQLRVHIKDNILYYMQAIWSYEPIDQRYFRLFDIEVSIPEPNWEPPSDVEPSAAGIVASLTPSNDIATSLGLTGFGGLSARGAHTSDDAYSIEISADPGDFIERTVGGERPRLGEVADLDNLLGYKGNYMIFPLTTCTFMTDVMMQDYIDSYLGLRDPDVTAELSVSELLAHAERIVANPDVSEPDKRLLKEAIQRRLTSERRDDELIVVPTGQLFVEAIVGKEPVLEDFKKLHRALDVSAVEEEVREAELENLRRAYRIARGELEDPMARQAEED
ncbi:MAG: hypothetical protein AAFO63_08840, partial [Pseudomonadota bacterium]